MENRWKEIWNKNKEFIFSEKEGKDEFAVYRELKRLDGFDVSIEDAETYYRRFYDETIDAWNRVRKQGDIRTAYEVGCGSGANLYLLQNRGIKVGGIDYSDSLSNIARQIVTDGGSIRTDEAIRIDTGEKYDAVFSDSVFAYFPDEAYGLKVLEKMYEKATRIVMIREVFDKSVKQECEAYRKSMYADYEERYQGLDKVFYDREMFNRFAEERLCQIEFSEVNNEYYWNSKYLFNCCIYKNEAKL